jgi:putative endonuclease
MRASTYTVYILTNRYRTVYYIGMTDNLVRQLRAHRSGRGSVFTARYRVTDLIYAETYLTPRDAIRREKQLKGWRHAKKLALIHTINPNLATLPGPVARNSGLPASMAPLFGNRCTRGNPCRSVRANFCLCRR